MKKLFVFVLSTFFLTTFLNAQTEPKMHFGLKASPSLAWIMTDTKGISGNGTKFGFGYGLMTEFNFSSHYAFATGVDVNYRGGNLKLENDLNDSTKSTVEAKYTIQYVELPLTLKLKTTEIGYFTYYLQFGISPGINIRAKADTKTTTQVGTHEATVVEDNDEDVKDGINNFNLSMIISGGLEYTLSGSTVLLTGITFNNGFLDIFDGDAVKANSNFLALNIGILF